ncbi:MAG: cardiolipin synthase [Deltaproteobacteria bacterium]|nr:MAG: cardiolipin synthase [Deltaproteobacteria bacterium]
MDLELIIKFLPGLYTIFHFFSLIAAVHAGLTVRTSQGAVAWAVSLVAFPPLALPLYLVFGRNKFNGYIEALREINTRNKNSLVKLLSPILKHKITLPETKLGYFDKLTRFPGSRNNSIELLIDGAETFNAIFNAIDKADKYILIEFFTVHNDETGNRLKHHLITKAEAGVKIFFLYDEFGSRKLSSQYIVEMRRAGINIRPFWTTQGIRNRFQLNFRNHRKIVVVDGWVAFIGGHNIADEYLGLPPASGHWRDTHVRIKGPAVQSIQLAFTEDWYWSAQNKPDIELVSEPARTGNMDAIVLPSGPASRLEVSSLMFVQLINMAKKRLWIASPYFVPNQAVSAALQLAALRGVKIRIMLPLKPDHLLVYLASYSYLYQMSLPNIRFFRYEYGFMHQKVILVDDDLALVGTANIDNRSFYLNFEIGILVHNTLFARDVEKMLEDDFLNCRESGIKDYENKSWFFKLGVRLSHLFAPIL